MAHSFTGFSVSQRVDLEKIVIAATKILTQAHKDVIELQKQNAAQSLKDDYKRWFGTLTTDRLKIVTDVVTLLDYTLASGRVDFTYNGAGCNANTNAAAYRPAHGWKLAELTEALKKDTYKITLCPRFFAALPLDAEDRQSRVGTFIHELSHIVGNTEDEVVNGTTMYGRDNARILADRFPDQAVKNAENYGFYGTWLARKPQPEVNLADYAALLE